MLWKLEFVFFNKETENNEKNKKSAESDVAPVGIVIQVPICIEKNLFCSIQEIDGLVCKKHGQSRKFGILTCKI